MSRFERTVGQSPILPGTVSANGLVFTSGLIAPAAFAAITSGAVVPASRQIVDTVATLRATLAAAGVGVEDVVKVNAYLSSADLTADWNDAFLGVWPGGGPARTTLVVGFTSPAVHFELEAVAATP
ncbi:RidA family protein [Pseudonocardia xishanensis]|uniref:Enamine deaminase RidA (YjgF/YER057c/UK114 family) n=1 Tax=Pseudonocardia xishanensis TaxID=630995 RepID=A0ABP8S2I7_9PSEU